MQTERMSPEPSEGWKPLDDGTREYLIDGCPGIDDAFYFELAPKLWGALMYTEQRLRAVEQENRTLREGLDHIVNQSGDSPYEILCQVCRDGKTQCWSRKHSKDVARDTLARAGGGADAAV